MHLGSEVLRSFSAFPHQPLRCTRKSIREAHSVHLMARIYGVASRFCAFLNLSRECAIRLTYASDHAIDVGSFASSVKALLINTCRCNAVWRVSEVCTILMYIAIAGKSL